MRGFVYCGLLLGPFLYSLAKNIHPMEETQEYHFIERIGFGLRIGAFILDCIFISIIISICAVVIHGYGNISNVHTNFMTGMTTFYDREDETLVNFTLIASICILIYSMLEAITGASIGKRIVGIKIMRQDVSDATVKNYLARWSIKNSNIMLSIIGVLTGHWLFPILSFCLGLFLMLSFIFTLGGDKQALHDIFTKTAVYKNKHLVLYKTKPLE